MPTDLDQLITAALSADADSLTISEWTEDTVSARDRQPALPQGRPESARRRSWTALGAAALVVAVATTVTVLISRAPQEHTPISPGTTTYALPSNGWTPGAATRDARFFGPFMPLSSTATPAPGSATPRSRRYGQQTGGFGLSRPS
jgi:hypothetical protein